MTTRPPARVVPTPTLRTVVVAAAVTTGAAGRAISRVRSPLALRTMKLCAVVWPGMQRTPTVPPPMRTRAVDPSAGQVIAMVRITAELAGALADVADVSEVDNGVRAGAVGAGAALAANAVGCGGAGGAGGRVAAVVTLALGVNPQITVLRSPESRGTQLTAVPILART